MPFCELDTKRFGVIQRDPFGGRIQRNSSEKTQTTCGVDACKCNNIYSANHYHIGLSGTR